MRGALNVDRYLMVALLLVVISACGGEGEPRQVDVQIEGEVIPVRSDPASYQLIRWSELPNGNREALTRRDGSSGTSYARREIDCRNRTFRYLGEGDTREEAEADAPNPGPLAELVTGSISEETARFVCAK